MTLKVPRRAADLLLYGLFLVFAGLAYSVTSTFPSPLLPGYPGSAMFPRLVLIAMAVICAFGLARTLIVRRIGPELPPLEVPIGGFLLIVASLAGFAVLLNWAGMEVAVFAFIAGALTIRTRNLLLAAGSGIAAVVVVYLLFVQALSVHLPLTVLPRYLSTVF